MISKINPSELHDLSELDKAQIIQSVWNNIKELDTPVRNYLAINIDRSDMHKKTVNWINQESPFQVGTDQNAQLQTYILGKLKENVKEFLSNVDKRESLLSANQLINAKVSEIANQKAHEDLHNRLTEENMRFLLGIYPHFKALEAAYDAANDAAAINIVKLAILTHL